MPKKDGFIFGFRTALLWLICCEVAMFSCFYFQAVVCIGPAGTEPVLGGFHVRLVEGKPDPCTFPCLMQGNPTHMPPSANNGQGDLGDSPYVVV